MSKKAVMISIDEELHKKAKETMINISNECERALKLKLYRTTIKDAPIEIIRLKCSSCGSIVKEGYLCEISNKFKCKACEVKNTCKFDRLEEHRHILIPGFNNENKEKISLIK